MLQWILLSAFVAVFLLLHTTCFDIMLFDLFTQVVLLRMWLFNDDCPQLAF